MPASSSQASGDCRCLQDQDQEEEEEEEEGGSCGSPAAAAAGQGAASLDSHPLCAEALLAALRDGDGDG